MERSNARTNGMTDDEPGIDLVERWRSGDEEAAELLYGRYIERMMRIIRGQIPQSMNARIDPEDIAQSVFRTVFRRMQNGEFTFHDDDDVWKLLVTIALNKARNQKKRNLADRRTVQREAYLGDIPVDESITKRLQAQPSISDVLAFNETLELIAKRLKPEDAELLALMLQENSQQDIADILSASTRTIRRRQQSIRQIAAAMLRDEMSTSPESSPPI